MIIRIWKWIAGTWPRELEHHDYKTSTETDVDFHYMDTTPELVVSVETISTLEDRI